jgi:AraC-like DNA-binding protein
MRKPDKSILREGYQNPPHRLLSEVTQIGWTEQTHARQSGLGRHQHIDTFEICYVLRGHVDWWAETKVYEVPSHHIYLTFPNEWHGGVDSMLHPCELFWVGVKFPKSEKKPWPGLSVVETHTLRDRLTNIRDRVFPAPVEIATQYWAILMEYRTSNEFSETAARAALHRLLISILRAYDKHVAGRKVEHRRLTPGIQHALEYARQNLGEEVRVEDLAESARLSASRFHTRFVKETGETPGDWLRRQRILKAKQLLLTSQRSVTDLAYDLGFPSSQYFATVFAKYTGLSPSDYRERGEKAGT